MPEDTDRQKAKFLGWLKRNGGAKRLTTCEKKLRHLGLDVDSTLSGWDPQRIKIAMSKGHRVVWLKDVEWADELVVAQGVEVPHHSQEGGLGRKGRRTASPK